MTDVVDELGVRSVKRFGWKPSLPDARDLIADTSQLTIAAEVDPRGDMPAVYDQGQLGACTANAVAAAVEYDSILDGADPSTPSRLFIYYFERAYEGSPATADTGAYGRDGFKVAHKLGVPGEDAWPYDDLDPGRFSVLPSADILAEAKRHRLTKDYRAVRRSVFDMKRALSNRQTIAFGFSVYESFESAEVARDGIMPTPGHGERMLGGHEVLMVGYLKDHPEHCLCRNSWSADWGIDGYFLMPWAVILDRSLSSDFRTIRRPLAN